MNAITVFRMLLGLAAVLGAAGGCGRSEQTYEAPPAADKPETSEDVEPSVTQTEVAADRPRREHPAYSERIAEQKDMVSRQIAWRRVGPRIKDADVLETMRAVPRHAFVPDGQQRAAYADGPLGIGYGQTISQPYIVAYMTELLKLNRNSKVLEIGTGSGYQAAVAAELAGRVYSIEIIKALGESARERLKRLGYDNVETKVADGYYGWPEKGPFEAIIVTAASSHVPPLLIEQLKPGGRLVIPLGSPWRGQELVFLQKGAEGTVRSRGVMGVRFVPMLGKAQER